MASLTLRFFSTLLRDFHSTMLSNETCIVVNGFFPSLTLKHILNAITDDVLGMEGATFSNPSEQLDTICR